MRKTMQTSTDRQTDRRTYYSYINGMKGIACLLIMVCHYLGLYKKAQSFVPAISALDAVLRSRFFFLLDASYWLYLFFVVSGYLVSRCEIKSVKEWLFKSIHRFVRLALPILFSCFMIYVVYLLVGFRCGETSALFQCQWYQDCYADVYTLMDVLLSPVHVLIMGDCRLNSPYWVLRMMLISSLIIYLLQFLLYKVNATQREPVILSALIVAAAASYVLSPILSACLVGMIISRYEENGITAEIESCYAFWFLAVAMSVYFLPRKLLATLFFASLIVFTPHIKRLHGFFSLKPIQLLGKLSWGVYSFHWPVICSFGAWTLLELTGETGLLWAYALAIMASLTVTFALSALYSATMERLAAYLTKKLSPGE